MTLDLLTVVALTALSAFLMGASITLANSTQSDSDPSMVSLGYACMLQSLGWLAMGLRNQIPLPLSIVVSNLALTASALCYLKAVNLFVDGAVPTRRSIWQRLRTAMWALCGLYIVAILFFTFVAPSTSARIAANGLIQAFVNALCAWRLLRCYPLPKSRRIVGVGFGASALFQAVRVPMALAEPIQSADLATVLATQTATLILGHIAVVMLTFLFVLMVSDRAARELRALVNHDYLTGIFNRSAFEGFARQSIEEARRSGQPLSLLLFDIDHFKGINDTLGHLTGDVALRAMTDVTMLSLRSQDVLGRYGGEEFAVLLPATDAEGARLVAERVRQSVEAAKFEDNGIAFQLTVSIGVAQLSLAASLTTEQHLTALFRAADSALYAAKRAGRNRTLIAQTDPGSAGATFPVSPTS